MTIFIRTALNTILLWNVFMYFVTVIFNLYGLTVIFSSILKVFFYLFDTLGDNQLTLINPVNNVSNASALFFSLLIYQIISGFIFLIVGSVFYSTYLVFTQHACCQFSIIMYVLNKKKDMCYNSSTVMHLSVMLLIYLL